MGKQAKHHGVVVAAQHTTSLTAAVHASYNLIATTTAAVLAHLCMIQHHIQHGGSRNNVMSVYRYSSGTAIELSSIHDMAEPTEVA